MDAIRIAIVEDQRPIREALCALVEGTDGLRCAGSYGSMEEALRALGPDSADVALVDIGLPGLSGIEGIRVLKERCPELRTLALTIYQDDDRIFEALCAGASGYLLKKTPPARLVECLREVMAGGAPMSPEVASRVLAVFRALPPPATVDYHLTPHELRLLKLLADGHGYKTAAAELGSSVHTIDFHLRSVYGKLQVHSKSEAVAKALRHRLVR
jgi:DNA-binding NarL/FixJ family response regulator